MSDRANSKRELFKKRLQETLSTVCVHKIVLKPCTKFLHDCTKFSIEFCTN